MSQKKKHLKYLITKLLSENNTKQNKPTKNLAANVAKTIIIVLPAIF